MEEAISIFTFFSFGAPSSTLKINKFQYLIRSDHVLGELPWITDFNGILTAAGSILYSFEGQAMVCNSMALGFTLKLKIVGLTNGK